MKAGILVLVFMPLVLLSSSSKKIKGLIKMNGGDSYNSVCECSNLHNTKECDPQDLRLVKDRGDAGSKPHIIRELFSPGKFTIKPINETPFTCVDGRQNGQHMYSVGGDPGSLFIGLTLYELSLNRELTKAEIKAAIESYLSSMSQEYMTFSIDSNARDYLIKAAGQDTVNLSKPKQPQRQKLLPYVANAEAQGDLFFKVLKKYKSKFGIKSGIVELFIQSLYQILWELQDKAEASSDSQPKLKLEVIQGEHQQLAFIDIRLGTMCKTNVAGPILLTKNTKFTGFIHSFDAALLKLEQIGKFIVGSVSHGKLDEKIFLNRLNKRYLSYFNQLGMLTAKSLDFYTASLLTAQKK